MSYDDDNLTDSDVFGADDDLLDDLGDDISEDFALEDDEDPENDFH